MPIIYNREIADMERCIIGLVLKWKLCHTTPFELIHALVTKLEEINVVCREMGDRIKIKAVQISELLLICIFSSKTLAYGTLDNHSILSIALASLYGAMEILGMNSLKHYLDEYTNTENRV